MILRPSSDASLRGKRIWQIAELRHITPRWKFKQKSVEIKNIPQYTEGQKLLHRRFGFCLLRGGGGGNPYPLSDKIFEGYLMTFLNLPQLFLKFTQFDWMNQNLTHGWDCGSQMPLKCDTFCWVTVCFCPIQPFNRRRGLLSYSDLVPPSCKRIVSVPCYPYSNLMPSV